MNIFGKRSGPVFSETRNHSAHAENKTARAQAAGSGPAASGTANAAPQGPRPGRDGSALPWYAGQYKDVLFYLLIAVLFVELIVGGVAFFYGLMRSAPVTPGGRPWPAFPGWAGQRPQCSRRWACCSSCT